MQRDTTQWGIAPCITPSGIFFDTHSTRALAPEELMRLQGLPLEKITFTTESRAEMQDLAGNAMSSPVAGSGILAAIMVGYRSLQARSFTETSRTEATNGPAIAQSVTESVDVSFGTSTDSDIIVDLMKSAADSAQHCVCEGALRVTSKPLQTCVECGHTSCIACGGNPPHSYTPLRRKSRQNPIAFEQKLRSLLPLQLAIKVADSLQPEVDGIFRKATNDTFSFSSVVRGRDWTIEYTAPSASLRLVIGKTVEWRLFAKADDSLPADDELRANFKQPIAKSIVTSHLLGGDWSRRGLFPGTQAIKVAGTSGLIPSWRSRMEMPDYELEKVPDEIKVAVPPAFDATLDLKVSGTYKALPHCGTASNSLYKRISGEGGTVYLLQDPAPTSDPILDCFVFSRGHEKVEYGQNRSTIASLARTWRPWSSDEVFRKPQIDGHTWQHVNFSLSDVTPDMELRRTQNIGMMQLDCSQADLLASCRMTGMPDFATTSVHLFKEYAFALEAIRRHLPNEEWRELDVALATDGSACAPCRPHLRWMWHGDTGIKPYDDAVTAGVYERSMKCRPEPMVLQIEQGELKLGVNLASLAHRAVAHLPTMERTNLSWIMQQTASGATLRHFKLRETEGDAFTKDLGLNFQLFPKQRLVLSWMVRQEGGRRFMVEAADEAVIPALGWRVEVRAQAPLHVRGGICADLPGFGKTITSLALIHHGLQESDGSILRDLRKRQCGDAASAGLLPTKATLIVAPPTLIKQWKDEIREKLGYGGMDVLLINSVKDLSKFTISDFERAKIVVTSRSVLGKEEYSDRLAAFAALPGPVTQSGRAFTHWLQNACKKVPNHLEVLRSKGLAHLRTHAQAKFAELQDSHELRTIIPSKRLVGSEFAKAAGKQKQPAKEKPKKLTLPTEHLGIPLFEMFYFNRLIVDEFQLSTAREYASIKALKADKRWGLSATPALSDSYDISHLAGLLHIPLRIGSASARFLNGDNIRNHNRDLTDFEQFDATRQMPSDSMHARIHEHGQEFLDAFCRQNAHDFDIPFQEHLVPVTLDQSHQAEYAELFGHLSAQGMNITKAKTSSSVSRDIRFNEAVGDIKNAEEVLSRAAAFHDGRTVSELVDSVLAETERTIGHLRTAVAEAKRKPNNALDNWETTALQNGTLGDADAITEVRKVLESTSDPCKVVSSAPKKKKKRKVQSDEEDDRVEKETSGTKTSQEERNLAAEVNTLAKCLRTSTREARYFKNIRFLQQVLSKAKRWQCDSQSCSNDGYYKAAVSPVCGHLICEGCHMNRNSSTCPAVGCIASFDNHHLQWLNDYDSVGQPRKHGAKIQAALSIIRDIRKKGDKAILFVQYEQQLFRVETALLEAGIPATILTSHETTASRVDEFNKNKDPVIVIDASGEAAAGLNLQIANHVIFLSPLLREQQYYYDATMAQAVGRVRRHGQEKDVHVHRIFALRTIDVDVLEHRERRTTAITQQDGEDISPPPAASMLDHNGKPERTQLVRDEKGHFSLRPRSWLTRCDADHTGVLNWDRVAGWGDFSSRVKWTAKFLEDDTT